MTEKDEAGATRARPAPDLFIGGDPRLLSGGAPRNVRINYDETPDKLDAGDRRLRTSDVPDDADVWNFLEGAGQTIHHGKSGYHFRPTLNVFLEEGDEFPSVGVELETILRNGVSRDAMLDATRSNWFHFEEDGSLRRVGDGYECITEPLPSRVYRDARLWIGLQNLLVPWLYSWGTDATGLHVHVGIDRFESLDAASVPRFLRASRAAMKALGRHLMAFAYEYLADDSLLDAVFLRPRLSYCGRCGGGGSLDWYAGAAGRVTASDLVAAVVRDVVSPAVVSQYCSGAAEAIRDYSSGAAGRMLSNWRKSEFLRSRPYNMETHNHELNASHSYTFEIRRGKGTVNGTSIHRMVEFAALVEKYAEKLMTEPDACPSSQDFREFILAKTTSDALAEVVEKHLKGDSRCA